MREVNYDERWKVARDLACKINLWPTVENLQHIDAALRRAKAEGQLDGITEAAELVEAMPLATNINIAVALRFVARQRRAAQIEEGE